MGLALLKFSATTTELLKRVSHMKGNGVNKVKHTIEAVGGPANVMYGGSVKSRPRTLANLPKGVYMKGNSAGVYNNATTPKKAIPLTKKTHRSANASTFMHEAGEGTSALRGEHTTAGAAFGHPNISRTLVNESNLIAKGDKSMKRVGKTIKSVRSGRKGIITLGEKEGGTKLRSEIDTIKDLMPIGVDGKKAKFKFGKTRLNRRMREEMMKKEFQVPASTTRKEFSKIRKKNRKGIEVMIENDRMAK